ncbi:Four helix bundle sensory module for signal transduction [Pseudomonas sp. NFACC02]|uniref:MCP four helix bundle domain-containing protein n=1 Tax=Pseudomonas sp. NFACC02 TaxID=1566250 RepID=UPI0008B6E7F2|nr:Four helix bundle sensory module for signal transduction [Pseudomonas sp. NFACC02]
MSFVTNLNLKPKLLGSFGLCALITIAVGVLGQFGITRLFDLFQGTISNNLVSIMQVDSVKANVIATNRDFFKVIALVATKSSSDDIASTLSALARIRLKHLKALGSIELPLWTPMRKKPVMILSRTGRRTTPQ